MVSLQNLIKANFWGDITTNNGQYFFSSQMIINELEKSFDQLRSLNGRYFDILKLVLSMLLKGWEL